MALSQSTLLLPSLLIPSLKRNLVGESQNPITAILPTTETPKYRLISSGLTSRNKPCSHLRTINCVSSAGDGSRESSSISSLFVKGLPDSVSEGRLRKVFSEFGQQRGCRVGCGSHERKGIKASLKLNKHVYSRWLGFKLWSVFRILLTKACSLIPGLRNPGRIRSSRRKPIRE
ncbi:unnamed protein product [Arabis nemorensis]|uniref:Uncharacterized protein n=1 Tax=Arabis nemorensis TaxID=586526 RepID=A0A565CNG1_9BRAS|nr:unnamed protein product [Arabis nemorensis]